jgi:hypothetical protein
MVRAAPGHYIPLVGGADTAHEWIWSMKGETPTLFYVQNRFDWGHLGDTANLIVSRYTVYTLYIQYIYNTWGMFVKTAAHFSYKILVNL